MPKNVALIVAFGQTAQKINKSAKKYGFKNIIIAKTLKESMVLCKNNAKNGDVVILSPACASFDQFKNFEERGNVFKKIVEEFYLHEINCLKHQKET